MMTEAQKEKAQQAQEQFWNSPGVRKEFSFWVKAYGPKLGSGVFWGLQETQDIARECFRGKKLTPEELEERHALALKWNALRDEDEDLFWEAYHYEAVATNRWVQEPQDGYGIFPRASKKYGKRKDGGFLLKGADESECPATKKAIENYHTQQKALAAKLGADAIPF
jgi:hypothetical protein